MAQDLEASQLLDHPVTAFRLSGYLRCNLIRSNEAALDPEQTTSFDAPPGNEWYRSRHK
jgi:hypothetical protein